MIELRASSAQRFQVRLHSTQGASPLYVQPFQNVWIRAVLPLKMFWSTPQDGATLSEVFNQQRAGHFMFHWGPYLPVTHISGFSFGMERPLGEPILEIRSVRLTPGSPVDAILEDTPLVDEMGQWIRDQWPGKILTLEVLHQAWKQEEKQMKAVDFGYCRYGGYRQTKARPTNFFRVEQVEGRWGSLIQTGIISFLQVLT